VGRAITYGTEASLETSFILAGVQMDMGGSATLSRAIDRSNEDAPSYGKQLRYTPELSTSLYAAAELARFSFDASARYVGARFITSDESMRLDGYFVVDTQVSYRLPVDSTELLWAIQIENVLNTDYSVVRFYPMPPRSISLRFGVEL
jgi:iron complex outermembrane receptor protein